MRGDTLVVTATRGARMISRDSLDGKRDGECRWRIESNHAIADANYMRGAALPTSAGWVDE